MKTLLERAKGTPLTIVASRTDSVCTVSLLPPHTIQIANLEFTKNCWRDIQRFSVINSGPLPLLRTLNMNVVWRSWDEFDMGTSLSHSPFSEAKGLKEFRLHSQASPFLSHFVFPNLTSFDLSATLVEEFRGSELLDFLEASPMLQVVRVKIVATLSLEGVARERVVVLQHVGSLCLTARDGGPGYELATHISCPSVKNTSITYMSGEEGGNVAPLDLFPTLDSFNAIIRQYTRSPIEEIGLERTNDPTSHKFITYSLTLLSADTTVINFHFKIIEFDGRADSLNCDVFSKACKTIQDLPLLANVKHLYIHGLPNTKIESTAQIAHEFGGLLKSLGPLEELTICRCDMRSFFLHYPEIIVGYPPIRVLTLSDPENTLKEDVAGRLVGLAKAQHRLGVPFERVTVHSPLPLADVGEMLSQWVGVVDCSLYDRS